MISFRGFVAAVTSGLYRVVGWRVMYPYKVTFGSYRVIRMMMYQPEQKKSVCMIAV